MFKKRKKKVKQVDTWKDELIPYCQDLFERQFERFERLNKDDIIEFIEKYDASQLKFIKFDWNKKHGDDLRDPNIPFRLNVFYHYLFSNTSKNKQLEIDLFREICLLSKEAWGGSPAVKLLVDRLFENIDKETVSVFANYHALSMDTYLCSNIPMTIEMKQSILSIINELIQDKETSELKRCKNYFEDRIKNHTD